ncbi:Tetracycline resistance protein, class A (TetA(A)) [Pseudovibrio sp. FO-BEG1]|uniref:TCR/Tet family MFS transporter n=1 Tax=unclassified Pseudovibrio TaxID=2627060 RepID=UPI000238C184|nr:tetracycline resistance MFS efflux pump [Pseudovibrio sp. FO-BEG1]AEV39500.1 Tetracycline resistance protein, class A (TetA(A)) [Pseudovibrio sp. FO-BEG1]
MLPALQAIRSKQDFHTLVFIAGTVLLNAIGAGLIIPVTPALVAELSQTTIADAALWGGYIAASYAAMQFLFGPAVGAISDRFGRRPVLLISLAVLTIDYLIMTFAGSLWVLFIGRLLAGVASATYATAYAAVSDISHNGKRATRFGMVGAAIGFGFVIGPVIGGTLALFGIRVPFYISAILIAITFVYGLFYMPETLPKAARKAIRWRRANPVGAALDIAQTPVLMWLFIALFLFEMANFVYPAIWPYYTIEAFHWTTAQVGLSLAIVGIGFSSVKGGLIRWIIPRKGEAKTVLYGFFFAVIALLGFAFAPNTLTVILLLPPAALGAMIPPAMIALMSHHVSQDKQGRLQGALTSIIGLTLVLSTLMMTQLFTHFTADGAELYYPGAPFLLAATFMVLAIGPFLIGLKKISGNSQPVALPESTLAE